MTSIYPAAPVKSFDELVAQLKTFPTPLFPPGKSYDPTLTDAIASLYLQPALEALLHILNHDLPSAHFLLRQMQSPPAYEGMYLHGILHRIEGDFDNARAWYSDVSKWGGFEKIWGTTNAAAESDGQKVPAQQNANDFLDHLEAWVRDGKKEESRGSLERRSRNEFDVMLDWCVEKFGTQKDLDANQDWVQPSDEINKQKEEMTSGSGGQRKF